jgi:hypothetical protein
LHAVLAVEPSLANTVKVLTDELKTTFSKKPELFRGFIKDTKFHDDSRQSENTSETKNVAYTVGENLDYVVAEYIKYYDGLATKEATNQISKADLVIDGKTVATGLPGTFLLGLEKRLSMLRELLLTIPTLDPTHTWSADTASSKKGVYRSEVSKTFKTELHVEYVTLAPPTDKHPAQVKDWSVQKPVATIEQTAFSGMWTVQRKADVLARLENLLRCVTESRMNSAKVDAVDTKIGETIFKYLLGN